MNVQLRELSTISPNAFVSQASYWTPEMMHGSAWIEHAPFAFWLMSALRPRVVVELGVHRGFSYFVLCQAVQRLNLSTRCYGVDTWVGDEHAGFYTDEVYEQVSAHNRRYDTFSRMIRSDFADACDQFADGSIDLLHIDGCHTYEAVRRDFESWLPKLSPRGVMVFHDTAEYCPGFGVHELWDQVSCRYPHFEFRHGHGLGILGVGENPPAQIADLFHVSASAAATQTIRAAYERLGGYVGSVQQLAEQERETAVLAEQLRHSQVALASYETSTSWRITAPLRALARLISSANSVVRRLRDTLHHAASAPAPVEPAYRPDHYAEPTR